MCYDFHRLQETLFYRHRHVHEEGASCRGASRTPAQLVQFIALGLNRCDVFCLLLVCKGWSTAMRLEPINGAEVVLGLDEQIKNVFEALEPRLPGQALCGSTRKLHRLLLAQLYIGGNSATEQLPSWLRGVCWDEVDASCGSFHGAWETAWVRLTRGGFLKALKAHSCGHRAPTMGSRSLLGLATLMLRYDDAALVADGRVRAGWLRQTMDPCWRIENISRCEQTELRLNHVADSAGASGFQVTVGNIVEFALFAC
eukprot:CAMPEP_0117537182 /NCGR_PEP_ID=MMETSP0784-20121206/41833_1 /TAXON_ID=39447 /ORGANISM="" /LENGTH=255 /DNA_ID=CAMNT_0005333761 /DNA_START=48 /DNA_END=815 /DNA_ORIENTATION=-